MSVTQWAEVEAKVHRLCQEFSHIHRGTVKQIFHLVSDISQRYAPELLGLTHVI